MSQHNFIFGNFLNCIADPYTNVVTKEEFSQNEQCFLLPQCFPLLVIGYPFNSRDCPIIDKICSKCLLQNCRMRERIKRLFQFKNKRKSIWNLNTQPFYYFYSSSLDIINMYIQFVSFPQCFYFLSETK